MITQYDEQIRVRYQETDAMGRVHHASFFTYFEIGRTELLRVTGQTYRQFEERGLMLVVTEISCRYFAPALYDDLLTVRTTTAAAKGARIEHSYIVLRGDTLLADGRSVVACVDRTGKARRLPPSLF
ncbi:MAG: thioesterase family protein [Pirellulales bacterium]